MHIQRVILLPPAALGAVAISLSLAAVLQWAVPSFELAGGMPAGKNFQWTISMDWISLICFLLSILMTLVGGLARPMSLIGRVVIFLLALVPLATALLVVAMYSTLMIDLMDWGMSIDAELFWPGFATWLTLAAAIVMIVSSVVVGWIGRDKAPAVSADNNQAGAVA